MDRCTKCGRLHPRFARERSTARSSSGTRALIYEGYSPGGKVFTYAPGDVCLPCRAGTPSQLRHRPSVGEALKQELVRINERR